MICIGQHLFYYYYFHQQIFYYDLNFYYLYFEQLLFTLNLYYLCFEPLYYYLATLMPKVIEKYVLQQKIGNGQFGEVFKGHHQDTKEIVAVKSIRRENIKGKFYELLENQIKVLKTCDNPYIMKLYCLKKTPNNYYLMLEYCNEGDMLAKVRKEKTIEEDLVIKYFCQILNGFQTLVKHKIMHRDFKLANILLHDGNIKIADFGFAKLLHHEEYATTMLGSPLNMAPEVLGNTKYNSKADIWSIGACIYEMLYGKPPFIASNVVDLLKLIKNKPVTFPPEITICQDLKDVLKKMLVPDVKKRINWVDLFSHPIGTYLDQLRRKQVDLQLVEDESLMLNTSKYYLKNNLVINRPEEIEEKEGVNKYLVDVIKNGKKNNQPYQSPSKKVPINKNQQEDLVAKSSLDELKMSKIYRKNSKKLLHFRNIYAFLATISDQILKNEDNQSEIASYVLVQKILDMIIWLKKVNESEECPFEEVQLWKEYREQIQFKEIKSYIENEYNVFKIFNESIEPEIKSRCLKGEYDGDIKEMLMGVFKESVYRKYLVLYLKNRTETLIDATVKRKDFNSIKRQWKELFFAFHVVKIDQVFGYGDSEFNFKQFYNSFDKNDSKQTLLEIQKFLIDLSDQ